MMHTHNTTPHLQAHPLPVIPAWHKHMHIICRHAHTHTSTHATTQMRPHTPFTNGNTQHVCMPLSLNASCITHPNMHTRSTAHHDAHCACMTRPHSLSRAHLCVCRTKLLNPRWAEAMAAQGSGGAYEISQRMTAMVRAARV